MAKALALGALLIALPASAADGIALEPSGGPGPCSIEAWKRDWPGCEFEDGVAEGRLSIVEQGGERWWRVAYAPGQIGPDKGGVGWRWPFTRKPARAAELRYTVLFEEGFDFAKGGKLPGLCGGPKTITGGERCTGFEGWSVRVMWRREGRGQAYAYHPRMKGKYGDEFDFPADFRFPPGVPAGIRIAVAINAPGQCDGVLRVWVALPGQGERLVVERTAMEWTKAGAIGVDGVLFNTFHGGNDATWAPSRPCAARFGRIEVFHAQPLPEP